MNPFGPGVLGADIDNTADFLSPDIFARIRLLA